ncbi:hypothetical protein [Cyclobacterium xiamenense]|uniref:hypothetical protein n=1 Tax=Cyclobacterium xiamenense TaxID=1297121 RepID=UPI0035D0E3D9
MKKIYPALLLACLLLTLVPLAARAQKPKPPLPVEVLFGQDRFFFQMEVIKKFTEQSRFGLLSIATFAANYRNDRQQNSLTIPVQVNYTFKKGFGLMAGVENNDAVGFSPVVGPQHVYASRTFLAVTIASYFLNGKNDLSLFGLYEYRPPLGEGWSLYSRLQFLYNRGLSEGQHNRSFVYLRGGVKKDQLIFGLGANLDQYGPEKSIGENYGLFVRWEFY